jgi:hypothetical protein
VIENEQLASKAVIQEANPLIVSTLNTLSNTAITYYNVSSATDMKADYRRNSTTLEFRLHLQDVLHASKLTMQGLANLCKIGIVYKHHSTLVF